MHHFLLLAYKTSTTPAPPGSLGSFFAENYFAGRYFSPPYFNDTSIAPAGAVPEGSYFAEKYFAGRFFSPPYFDDTSIAPYTPPAGDGSFFAENYFAGRFFSPPYFEDTSIAPAPAGDALQQLLDTMSVRQVKRLNDRAFNMRTGVSANTGLDLYSRQFYDRNFQLYGSGTSASFSSDDHVKNAVMGTDGGGSTITDNARLIYSGMAHSKELGIVVLRGGGHTSGAYTHTIYFDYQAAASTILATGTRGTWDQYTDPFPYGKTANASVTESGAYPPYGRNSNFKALAGAQNAFRYPQPFASISGYTRLATASTGNGYPYSMHDYTALYDPINSVFWFGGGNVGLPSYGESFYDGAADYTHKLDPTTRMWTPVSAIGGGDPSHKLIMAPDGSNYIFTAAGTGGYKWYVMNIADASLTQKTDGFGASDTVSYPDAFWVEDFSSVGKYDLFYWKSGGTVSNKPFVRAEQIWPGVANTDGTMEVFPSVSFTGASASFTGSFGMVYLSAEKKIYTLGANPSGSTNIVIQNIDIFQGGATGNKDNWVVSTWASASQLTGLDTIDDGTLGQTGYEVYNRFQYLGPEYGAFILVCNGTYGDVYIIKHAERT